MPAGRRQAADVAVGVAQVSDVHVATHKLALSLAVPIVHLKERLAGEWGRRREGEGAEFMPWQADVASCKWTCHQLALRLAIPVVHVEPGLEG